jgi:hypothetical protein
MENTKLHPLTKALIAEQERQHLNDPQMAAKLGVTGSAWSLARRGLRRPGEKFINGTATSFPKINVTKLLREAAKEA